MVRSVPTGAANRNRLRPKPSGMTSSASAPESSSMSRPVIPTSRVPSPTYTAMSRGRR